MESWFIKMDSLSNRMFELNQEINWKPRSTGDGRFGNWLKTANDWNLSRSRFWGIPLPIWKSEDGSETKVIGSIEQLINEINNSVENGNMNSNPFDDFEIGNMSDENYDKIDLHKHTIDDIVLTSGYKKENVQGKRFDRCLV